MQTAIRSLQPGWVVPASQPGQLQHAVLKAVQPRTHPRPTHTAPHLKEVGGGVEGDSGGLVRPPSPVDPVCPVEHRKGKVLAVGGIFFLLAQLQGRRRGVQGRGGVECRIAFLYCSSPPVRCSKPAEPNTTNPSTTTVAAAPLPCPPACQRAALAPPPPPCRTRTFATALSFSSLSISAPRSPVISGARTSFGISRPCVPSIIERYGEVESKVQQPRKHQLARRGSTTQPEGATQAPTHLLQRIHPAIVGHSGIRLLNLLCPLQARGERGAGRDRRSGLQAVAGGR